MSTTNEYEVVIVGGSYAGLSAAMALGRSLRKVLIIDAGEPCNRTAPHSHNFITQDGVHPAVIAQKARQQVLQYPTVSFLEDKAVDGTGSNNNFEITTANHGTVKAKKLLFATGIKDIMPNIPGFANCWGISIIHCPYCHGYEVKGKPTGIMASGEMAFHFGKMILNWTSNLTLFTNGPSELTEEQQQFLLQHNISIVTTAVKSFVHHAGQLQKVVLQDNTEFPLTAIYAKPDFVQHCPIPEKLNCTINNMGLLEVDEMQKTNTPGVFAAGDNSTKFRSVAVVVAEGTKAGAMINHDLINETF